VRGGRLGKNDSTGALDARGFITQINRGVFFSTLIDLCIGMALAVFLIGLDTVILLYLTRSRMDDATDDTEQ
jgi:hypothetical protein